MSDRHYVHHDNEVQLAKILKESRPWLERYGTTFIYALAAVFAIAAVYVYVSRQPPATEAESKQLLNARSAEDFRELADSVPDSPIGILARVKEGELRLASAMRNLYSNRKVGTEELDAAEKVFRKLEDRKDLNGETRLRVLAGLARVVEARCDGSAEAVTASIDAWDRILKEFPDSKMFNDLAAERKKKLNLEETKSFYAWFQQQDPKPGDDLLLPQDGPPTVPDIPNIQIPDISIPDLTKPADESGKAESGAAPAEGSAPAPTTPAGDPAKTPAPESATTPPANGASDPAKAPAPAAEGTTSGDGAASGTESPSPAPSSSTPTPEKSGE